MYETLIYSIHVKVLNAVLCYDKEAFEVLRGSGFCH